MNKRILIVDDEPDIRMIMRFILERAGHDVVEADDGERALEILARGDRDLVFLDLRMPGVDGWAVLERLRDDGRLATLPVIIVSAYANDPSIKRAQELGCRGYISKPFVPKQILDAVANHVPA